MPEDQTVIYTARTSQEAHLLRNLLAELGMPATVENDLLEGGSGVDVSGWTTQARVVVAGQHAEEARRIALEFERKCIAESAEPEPLRGEPEHRPPAPAADPDGSWPDDEETTADTILDAWPICPECGAKRTTQCPICKTTGDDFPAVDMGFVWVPGPVEEEEAPGSSCGGGCHTGKPDDEHVAPEDNDELPAHGADPPATFICTMCDEPFVPEHASVCSQCGHVFPDGYEADAPGAPAEEIDSRIVAVAVALVLVALAFVAYFFYLA